MRSRTEELSLLRVKNAALEERVRRLEAKSEPKPPPRVPEIPKWAGSNSQNIGASYGGPPSVSQQGAAGIANIKVEESGRWRGPDGLLRDELGQIVPHPIAGMVERRPDGPQRSAAHEMAIQILDDGLRDQ
jgi:hypothetical protein